jgi:hypothetical protein
MSWLNDLKMGTKLLGAFLGLVIRWSCPGGIELF